MVWIAEMILLSVQLHMYAGGKKGGLILSPIIMLVMIVYLKKNKVG